MAMTAAGFALALDQLTDATNGINKVSIFSNLAETAKQTISFAAASGTDNYGTVVMSDAELVFNIGAGEIVQAVGLYHDTTHIATYIFPSQFNFTNAGTFTLTDLTIRLE